MKRMAQYRENNSFPDPACLPLSPFTTHLLTVFSERHEHGVVGVLLDLVGRRVVGDHGEAGQVRVLRLVAVAVLEGEVPVAAARPQLVLRLLQGDLRG